MVRGGSQVSSSSSSDPSSGSTATSLSSDPSSGSSIPPASSSGSSSGATEVSSATVPVVREDEECDETDFPVQNSINWGSLTSVVENMFPDCHLQNDQYLFGRGLNSDYVFDMRRFDDLNYFKALSSRHFKIFKESHSRSDKNDYTVFLEDLSSNGTQVNGIPIGRNRTKALKSGDEISLISKKVFIFYDVGELEIQQKKFPKGLREKYTILKVLGTGACGEVRLAYHRDSRKKFAVKIIPKKTFSLGPKMSKSLMDEVNILRHLDHPGIIKIEDFFDSDGALYIILELICGGELFDKVREVGKYDEKTSKLLFYQMLHAVSYLHSNSITHRDLKPENVLLATNELETAIKITDFGLSRIVGENSLMRTMCGTPNYLAPEILKTDGTEGYSKAVDCWSLGCILFICLAGYPPFSDSVEGTTIFQQIVTGSYSFPERHWSTISDEAKDLIRKLLTVDSADRISVDDALKHPWLQDEEMKIKARQLMSFNRSQGEPLNKKQNCPSSLEGPSSNPVTSEKMPPPHTTPVSRKLSDDESHIEAKRMKLSEN